MSNLVKATVTTSYGVIFERSGYPARMYFQVDFPEETNATKLLPPKAYAFFFVKRLTTVVTADDETIRGYGKVTKCSPRYYLGTPLTPEMKRLHPELMDLQADGPVISVGPQKFVFPEPDDIIIGNR